MAALTRQVITLMGMSGVGKTRLASMLRDDHWFHYSVDYRIGSHYLRHAILLEIKRVAMRAPELRDLLLSDSIYVEQNLSIDHLKPIANFLGKVGNPNLAGLSLQEFLRRQRLFNQAEIRALQDVPEFIDYSHELYGYPYLINDAGGSLCDLYEDLSDPEFERLLHTLSSAGRRIVYIEADQETEAALVERARQDPKPMYYRPVFFQKNLALYLQQHDLQYAAEVNPDDFIRWIFPQLYRERLPRYRAIAQRYGQTIPARELEQVSSAEHFLSLLGGSE